MSAWRILKNAFHLAVAVYACVLLVASIDGLYAQTREEVHLTDQVQEITRRLDSFEALMLDQRLIRIETFLDHLNRDEWESKATMGGIALLLARAVYAAIKRKEIL